MQFSVVNPIFQHQRRTQSKGKTQKNLNLSSSIQDLDLKSSSITPASQRKSNQNSLNIRSQKQSNSKATTKSLSRSIEITSSLLKTLSSSNSQLQSFRNISPPKILVKPILQQISPRARPNVENRLLDYKTMYDQNKSELKEVRQRMERSPSKEKPDINASSAIIVEKRKSEIFGKVFEMMAPPGAQEVDKESVQLHKVSIRIIDIFIDVFTELEEVQKLWSKELFHSKCNSAYQKMTAGQRSELLQLFDKKKEENMRSSVDSISQKPRKPETNAKSAQMSLNSRQYGVSANVSLYNQHAHMQRKKEMLKRKLQEEMDKECTFKPQINNDGQSDYKTSHRSITSSKSSHMTASINFERSPLKIGDLKPILSPRKQLK